MNATVEQPTYWSRPDPERLRPYRNAGGFYRTAGQSGGRAGPVTGNAEDAIIAAVRLAYRVADKQVDRSTRFARQLQQAGRRAGGPSAERDSVDALENLLLKTMLSGLSWWEGSVGEGRCPVKRLAAAEYRMLGQILGFMQPETGGSSRRDRDEAPRDSGGGGVDHPVAATAAPATSAPLAPLQPDVEIVLKGDVRTRRFVSVRTFVLTNPGKLPHSSGGFKLYFQHSEQEVEPLEGTLFPPQDPDVARLDLNETAGARPGVWRAVICDAANIQRGYIEIAL